MSGFINDRFWPGQTDYLQQLNAFHREFLQSFKKLAVLEIVPVLGQTRYPLPWVPSGGVSVFIGGLAMLPKNYSLDVDVLIVTEPQFFDGEVMIITALI